MMIGINITLGLLWLAVSEWKFRGNPHEKPQKKTKPTRSLPEFKFIQIATIIVFIYSALNQKFGFESTSLLGLDLFIPGVFVTLIGIILYVKSKYDLGSSFSPCADVEVPENLVTTGIYSKIRHPIYAANLVLVTGMAFSTDSVAMIIMVLVLYLFYSRSATLEEHDLCEKIPDYRNYMTHTGRFFPWFLNLVKISKKMSSKTRHDLLQKKT